MIALSTLSSPVSPIQTSLNMATLLFAPQPLAYARGSVRRRFGAANVRERMRNYL